MTDLGTADRFYVCGPDCKALRAADAAPVAEEHEDEDGKLKWWEIILTVALMTVVIGFATVGALDVGIRAALNYWHF